MDWGITIALNKLHQDHESLAVILAEILKKQDEILKVRQSQKTAPMDFRKLLQWPVPLYLISLGLLLANYKIPEVAELIRAFVGLQ